MYTHVQRSTMLFYTVHRERRDAAKGRMYSGILHRARFSVGSKKILSISVKRKTGILRVQVRAQVWTDFVLLCNVRSIPILIRTPRLGVFLRVFRHIEVASGAETVHALIALPCFQFSPLPRGRRWRRQKTRQHERSCFSGLHPRTPDRISSLLYSKYGLLVLSTFCRLLSTKFRPLRIPTMI